MIRIEIGAMPRLLRSIVSSALQTEGDMVVMAPAANEAHSTEEADVVIVCSDREPNSIPFRRLATPNSPAIVAIDSEGTSATILRVTAESTRIAAASDLCNAVRRAARDRSRTAN